MAKDIEIAQELLDDIAKHSLELQRVANGIDLQLKAELDKLSAELTSIIASNDFTAKRRPNIRRRMLNRVIARSKKLIERTASTLSSIVVKELGQVAKLEGKFALGSINRAVTGSGNITFATKRLGKKTLSKIAKKLIIRGVPQKELWKRQGVKLQNKFTDIIKDSWTNQQDIPTIAARIRGTSAANYKDGIMTTAKHHANSLARTSISSVSNQARQEVYLANRDVISGVKYLAVFDNRTTPVCLAHADEVWYQEGGGYGTGSRGHDFVPPPRHFNCRSTLVPVVKTPSELSGKKLRKVPKIRRDSLGKDISPPGGADTWLKTQPVKYQKEVLGNAYPGWKEGRMSFSRFVTQKGRVRTSKELGKIYKAKGKI